MRVSTDHIVASRPGVGLSGHVWATCRRGSQATRGRQRQLTVVRPATALVVACLADQRMTKPIFQAEDDEAFAVVGRHWCYLQRYALIHVG